MYPYHPGSTWYHHYPPRYHPPRYSGVPWSARRDGGGGGGGGGGAAPTAVRGVAGSEGRPGVAGFTVNSDPSVLAYPNTMSLHVSPSFPTPSSDRYYGQRSTIYYDQHHHGAGQSARRPARPSLTPCPKTCSYSSTLSLTPITTLPRQKHPEANSVPTSLNARRLSGPFRTTVGTTRAPGDQEFIPHVTTEKKKSQQYGSSSLAADKSPTTMTFERILVCGKCLSPRATRPECACDGALQVRRDVLQRRRSCLTTAHA
jgi:hypothetical protein